MNTVRVGFEVGNLYDSLLELPGGVDAFFSDEAKQKFNIAKQRLMNLPEHWAIIIDRSGTIIDEIKTR